MKPGTIESNRAAVDRYQRLNRERYLTLRRAARARRAEARPRLEFGCIYCPCSFATWLARGHHEGKVHPGLVPPHRAERAKELRHARHARPEFAARRRELRAKNRQKVLARFSVWQAVKDGRLERTPCVVCGATPVHGHHHNGYDRPLDVLWLCQRHHTDAHLGRAVA